MTRKKMIFTVTTDLTYDQRMDRICDALSEKWDVLLCGRKKEGSVPLQIKAYRQKRINCFCQKGKLFYIEYNIRLFWYLLFSRADLICGIDLDTAMPALIVSKIKRIPFVYDAHEYFTEMEEVVRRPAIKKVWLAIEKIVLSRTKYGYTVCESISEILNKKYNTSLGVIRNVSKLRETAISTIKLKKYIVYAGAINEGRGLEQLLEAMKHVDLEAYLCGEGDKLDELKELARRLKVDYKVKFLGNIVPEQLREIIGGAYIGYLLLTNKGLSYYFSLANKFFDYMHAGIPQVTIDFPEYKKINKKYEVAALVPLEVNKIIEAINKLTEDDNYWKKLSDNSLKARKEYNWQQESINLIAFYEGIPELKSGPSGVKK